MSFYRVFDRAYGTAVADWRNDRMSSPPFRNQLVPTAELVEDLLRGGHDVRLRVSGWSMKPCVRSGAVLRFSAAGSPPVVGDVVLARLSNDALVAHRVVGIESGWVRTKGDACRTADAPVPESRVLGSAVRLEGRAVSLPMRNLFVRRLGLALNRFYPMLVLAYRSLAPREGSSLS
jgi:hypothetical protein